jgi:carboxylesterase
MRPKTLNKEPSHPQRDLSPEADLARLTGQSPFLFKGGTTGCLLIHGFTGTPEEMRYLGDRLNRQAGLTVSGIELAGHGTDAGAFQERQWPDWYRSVEQGLSELSEMCSPLFVVGFSMGGLLAMALALRHGSRVKALALLATPLFANRHKARLAGLVYGLPGSRAWLRRQSGKTGWEDPVLHKSLDPAQMTVAQLKWILRRKAAGLTHPTLILQSRRDPSVPWGNAVALHNLISSPRKRLIFLTRSQHVLPLDLERDQVADEIQKFFLSC